MRTKQEYLLPIPFEYILAFSRETRLIRRNGYYTKKDFVQHLLRSLKLSECKQLYDFFNNGVPHRDAARYFLEEYPTGELVSKAFVDYLVKTTKNLGILLFEFPIPKTRVDILRLNNFSYAYEVKSQRDRIDRLRYQLPALSRIFERVCLIFASSLEDKIARMPTKTVGLYVFTAKKGQITFEIEREPLEIDEFEPDAQLELLRVDELKSLYSTLYEEEPVRKARRELTDLIIRNVDRYEINLLFKRTIQSRNRNQTRTCMLLNKNASDGPYREAGSDRQRGGLCEHSKI